MLTGAWRTLMDDGLAHGFKAGSQNIDDIFIAAHHDRKPRFASPDVAAGNRSIDGVNSFGFGRFGNLDGQGWLARGHIHEDRARLTASQRSLRAEHYFANI